MMAYRRFKLQDTPATLATTATLDDPKRQTVAEVASVADPLAENQSFASQTVANVATPEQRDTPDLGTDLAVDFERTVVKLKVIGIPLNEVESRTADIVRAGLRNDLRLYERQVEQAYCHVCGAKEDDDAPLVPVLNPAVRAGAPAHHWLHRACLDEHSRRITERVEAIFTRATRH